ncbi:MAG TPA: hypothetical protein VK425_01070, partial [Acidimicrobiales bacterium]|nr:hypothetical protein [Acidimicrobiales bacterium]
MKWSVGRPGPGRAGGRAVVPTCAAAVLSLAWCCLASVPVQAKSVGVPRRSAPTTTTLPVPVPKFGYLLASTSGAVFTFGLVEVKDSLAKLHVKPIGPVLGSAVTQDYHGYWLVDIYGGVYALGDAHFFGSCRQAGSGCQALLLPIIHIAATPDDKGYWLTSLDGGVFAFGDARFLGAADQMDPRKPPGGDNVAPLDAPVTSMAPTPSGSGYWLVTEYGTVADFGAAKLYGSVPYKALGKDNFIIAIASTPD